MKIHPTAIVDPSAELADDVEVGPYCIIGSGVAVSHRTRFIAHVFVEGITAIGEDNVFYPFSTIGVASQDKKYHGEQSNTVIGDRNTVREFVSIHRGTEGGGGSDFEIASLDRMKDWRLSICRFESRSEKPERL